MPLDTSSQVRLLRNTTFAIFALALVFLAGCAASAAEVKKARTSGYDADFATVYSEALAAVLELYPHTIEQARTGLIQTAWHLVSMQTESGSGRDTDPRTSNLANTNPTTGLVQTAPSDRKHYFVRFRVLVFGGKPWRIRIEGEASEKSAGDTPMVLKGAEVPPWLKGRVDAMSVAIYKRLKQHAIQIEEEIPQAEVRVVHVTEPGSFGSIPDDAQEFIASVHRSLSMRDMEALRHAMAEDMQWGVGEVGNADVAMAMWQADPTTLDSLTRVLNAGCVAGDGALVVSCPPDYSTEPNYSGHRVIFEKRAGVWRMTAFVSGE